MEHFPLNLLIYSMIIILLRENNNAPWPNTPKMLHAHKSTHDSSNNGMKRDQGKTVSVSRDMYSMLGGLKEGEEGKATRGERGDV